ncbi:hypothetical protein HN51_003936 [Arachis hypogaea]
MRMHLPSMKGVGASKGLWSSEDDAEVEEGEERGPAPPRTETETDEKLAGVVSVPAVTATAGASSLPLSLFPDPSSLATREKGCSNDNLSGGSYLGVKKKVMFSDLGGMKDLLEKLMTRVIVPWYHSELPRKLGLTPTTGILLHGPPGCGKTTLAHAIANETNVPLYQILPGASEENISDVFAKAYNTPRSIIFVDDIDLIDSKGIKSQLRDSMGHHHLLLIGATSKPESLDPALRGLLREEFVLAAPDEAARRDILKLLTCKLKGTFDLDEIARSTRGYVGADLEGVVREAGRLLMRRIIGERKRESQSNPDWWKQPIWGDLGNHGITTSDFQDAVKRVLPLLIREGFLAVPDVKWEDVGGLHNLKEEFRTLMIMPLKFPNICETFGIENLKGFLLFGPPGCGKTFIAKAVANEAGANFIHIKGRESEREVRRRFSLARACTPCVVLLDEVDALSTESAEVGFGSVMSQLLIELNDDKESQGVFVIGTTNRTDVIEGTLSSWKKLGKRFYVPMPGVDERFSILNALARKIPVDPAVNLRDLAITCENFSGAE